MKPTKAQRKALGDYLQALKLALWLGHWRIEVYWDGEMESDAYATIKPCFGQRLADLRLCHDFFDMEPWKQRRVLVHELIHCHMADAQEMGEQLRTNLGDQAFEAWMPGFRLGMEHGVDSLTTVLAHEDSTWLPLPDLPKSA